MADFKLSWITDAFGAHLYPDFIEGSGHRQAVHASVEPFQEIGDQESVYPQTDQQRPSLALAEVRTVLAELEAIASGELSA